MSTTEPHHHRERIIADTIDADVPRSDRRVDDPDFVAKVEALVAECGLDPATYDGRLVRDQMTTALKLIYDGADTGELRLITGAMKELRYAYTVFAGHQKTHKISIFGSARTQPEHPDYAACVEFSRKIAEHGWQVITGAGDGIMKAGHEGPGAESSFGLAIRLPFETTANEVIAGDDKLINFRYFFTRKLMFVSQAEAVAVFPGGFGTLDELYESLTLVQTGKSPIVPVVLIENPEGTYWTHWANYCEHSLMKSGLISPEDMGLFHITRDIDDAVQHVCRFYRNYHSSRYVRDELVLRLKHHLRETDVAELEREFAVLIKDGGMVQRGPLEVEREHLELPRLVFTHTKHKFGLVRALIDRINQLDPA
ncbi:MAG: LOG family protein [Planctomycetota bacterium]